MKQTAIFSLILGMCAACGVDSAQPLNSKLSAESSNDSRSAEKSGEVFFGTSWNIRVSQEKLSGGAKKFSFSAMNLKAEDSKWTPLEIVWQSSKFDRFFLKIDTDGTTSGIFAEISRGKMVNYILHPDSDLILPGEFYAAFDQNLISEKQFQVVDTLTTKSARSEKHFTVYCTEDRGVSKGYVFENAKITDNGGEFYLSEVVLGIGDLTQNGDGTASEGVIYRSGDRVVKETRKRDLLATSAQWRNSKAFPLTVEAKDAVLYVNPNEVQAKSEFKAGLKFLESNKNLGLSCNKV